MISHDRRIKSRARCRCLRGGKAADGIRSWCPRAPVVAPTFTIREATIARDGITADRNRHSQSLGAGEVARGTAGVLATATVEVVALPGGSGTGSEVVAIRSDASLEWAWYSTRDFSSWWRHGMPLSGKSALASEDAWFLFNRLGLVLEFESFASKLHGSGVFEGRRSLSTVLVSSAGIELTTMSSVHSPSLDRFYRVPCTFRNLISTPPCSKSDQSMCGGLVQPHHRHSSFRRTHVYINRQSSSAHSPE